MRVFLLTLIPLVTAFAPNLNEHRVQTKLGVDRRAAVYKGATVLAGIVGLPLASNAVQKQFGSDRDWIEQAKIPEGGKLDLNSAFVSDFKNLKEMYPVAADKLASNGPYKSVKDIYRIKDLTDRDIKTFKKYEDLFTVNKHPSGRTFTDKTSARIPAESEFLKKEFMGKKSDLFSS